MDESLRKRAIAAAGWIPAAIIPTATVLQLVEVVQAPDVTGVSWFTWFLFGIANLGFYVFAEKYDSLQAILGFLGSAALDFAIVATVLVRS